MSKYQGLWKWILGKSFHDWTIVSHPRIILPILSVLKNFRAFSVTF